MSGIRHIRISLYPGCVISGMGCVVISSIRYIRNLLYPNALNSVWDVLFSKGTPLLFKGSMLIAKGTLPKLKNFCRIILDRSGVSKKTLTKRHEFTRFFFQESR